MVKKSINVQEAPAAESTPEKVVKPSVSFNIGVPHADELEYIYITGSVPELGGWDLNRAIRVKRNKSGTYNKTVKMPLGTEFEFKILNEKSWYGVEKGLYYEEIENRIASVLEVKNKKIVEVKQFFNM